MSLFVTLTAVSMLIGIFHIGNNVVDFVEICNVCARKVIIEVAKRIINSDKVCPSYSDLNFGVTFFWNTVYVSITHKLSQFSR